MATGMSYICISPCSPGSAAIAHWKQPFGAASSCAEEVGRIARQWPEGGSHRCIIRSQTAVNLRLSLVPMQGLLLVCGQYGETTALADPRQFAACD